MLAESSSHGHRMHIVADGWEALSFASGEHQLIAVAVNILYVLK